MSLRTIIKKVLKEETSKIDPKKKGLELIKTIAKRKFPFIKNINLDFKPGISYNKKILVEFDLADFYEYSKSKPPWRPWLETIDEKINSLDKNESYLMFFIDYHSDINREKYGWEFNKELQNIINKYYSRLPKWMTYNQFEGMSDEELFDLAKKSNYNLVSMSKDEFYVKWRNSEEPVEFTISSFVPIINKEKLRKYYEE